MTAEGEPAWSLIDRRSEPVISLSVRDGVLFQTDETVQRD
jgi:hypothetical protein